jgi:hypothetical protein
MKNTENLSFCMAPQEKTRITFFDLREKGQKVISGFFPVEKVLRLSKKKNDKVTDLNHKTTFSKNE